ncbi:MAG: pyruvate dehydrogenase (acetyl-transferring) E1 component subunit alpha, partial [Flavobacteriales bacterium]|nr:pyruvate dehydrogenase (acetyl-transferring) E1 component subunit alpha [Flavobacteriales bacterium]
TLCYMGDGATRQGSFHETLNMAMNWKLPVIFIIENNHYAMGTSVERTSNVTELYKLGHAYEMPSYAIDGMRCEDVHDGISEATTRARKGEGPTLIEINTYRFKGHSMSDPAKYRTKEEVESYKAQDPIEQVLETIVKKKYATTKDIEAIKERVAKEVKDAVQFAEESPFPDAKELFEDVYRGENYPFITS